MITHIFAPQQLLNFLLSPYFPEKFGKMASMASRADLPCMSFGRQARATNRVVPGAIRIMPHTDLGVPEDANRAAAWAMADRLGAATTIVLASLMATSYAKARQQRAKNRHRVTGVTTFDFTGRVARDKHGLTTEVIGEQIALLNSLSFTMYWGLATARDKAHIRLFDRQPEHLHADDAALPAWRLMFNTPFRRGIHQKCDLLAGAKHGDGPLQRDDCDQLLDKILATSWPD